MDQLKDRKKINKYFFALLVFVVIIGFWPIALILFFSRDKITKEIEKALYKASQQTYTNQLDSDKKKQKKYNEYTNNLQQYSSNVGTDHFRSIITIMAFLALLAAIGFYYFLKSEGII